MFKLLMELQKTSWAKQTMAVYKKVTEIRLEGNLTMMRQKIEKDNDNFALIVQLI